MLEDKKIERAECDFGVGISASYDEAIKFADGFIANGAEKMFSGDNNSPQRLMLRLLTEAKSLDGVVEAIAFIYGKTPDEVRKDIMAA